MSAREVVTDGLTLAAFAAFAAHQRDLSAGSLGPREFFAPAARPLRDRWRLAVLAAALVGTELLEEAGCES